MALLDVVSEGDRRASLVAIRDRLADEMDDVTWQKHKAECRCLCGMGDGRTLVNLAKELRTVIAEIDELPGGVERRSKSDELADRRARRLADAANS